MSLCHGWAGLRWKIYNLYNLWIHLTALSIVLPLAYFFVPTFLLARHAQYGWPNPGYNNFSSSSSLFMSQSWLTVWKASSTIRIWFSFSPQFIELFLFCFAVEMKKLKKKKTTESVLFVLHNCNQDTARYKSLIRTLAWGIFRGKNSHSTLLETERNSAEFFSKFLFLIL